MIECVKQAIDMLDAHIQATQMHTPESNPSQVGQVALGAHPLTFLAVHCRCRRTWKGKEQKPSESCCMAATDLLKCSGVCCSFMSDFVNIFMFVVLYTTIV